MLNPVEKTLLYVMQVLNISKESSFGIMLLLKDNEVGQRKLLEYMKNSDPKSLTETVIISKVEEIISEV